MQVAVIVREERSGRLADGRSVTRLALAEVDDWRAATLGGPVRCADEPFKSGRLVHAGDLEGGSARGILRVNRRCQREESREQRGETLESDLRYERVRNVHGVSGEPEPARIPPSESGFSPENLFVNHNCDLVVSKNPESSGASRQTQWHEGDIFATSRLRGFVPSLDRREG
jgi:hypothetical protein